MNGQLDLIEECPVCYDSIELDNSVKFLQCNHTFCRLCALHVVLEGSLKCPIDGRAITKVQEKDMSRDIDKLICETIRAEKLLMIKQCEDVLFLEITKNIDAVTAMRRHLEGEKRDLEKIRSRKPKERVVENDFLKNIRREEYTEEHTEEHTEEYIEEHTEEEHNCPINVRPNFYDLYAKIAPKHEFNGNDELNLWARKLMTLCIELLQHHYSPLVFSMYEFRCLPSSGQVSSTTNVIEDKLKVCVDFVNRFQKIKVHAKQQLETIS